MAEPFVGEIRIFAGSFAPAGWLFCEGQLLPIDENDALFNLIGTTYGGDGETTFALPDLRGRIPIHQGNGFIIGETGGAEEITLTTNQIPAHTHPFTAFNAVANTPNPSNNLLGLSSQVSMFFGDVPNTPMNSNSISITGGSQPHTNLMPFLCVHFIISLFGIYPQP